MDLQNAVKKAGQTVRVPLNVIRDNPEVIRHVLCVCFEMPMARADKFTFSYGWADPRTGGIVILAQAPEDTPPLLMECKQVRTYRTQIMAYEVKPGHALLL